MKINNLKRVIALMLAAVVVGTTAVSMDVSAGSSDIVIDDSSFAESLNSSLWNAPNSDITVSKGKILFTKDHTIDTRLITKSAIVKSAQHEEFFAADFTLKLSKIPEGKKFAVAFSLANMESILGEEESIALVFTNSKGSLQAGVCTYDADGKEVVLSKAKSVGTSFGSDIKIQAKATTDMKFTITVNGSKVYDGEPTIDLAGRIGFLQNDTCLAEISHVNIVSHKYDMPENPNAVEDFENETININVFDSYMNSSSNYFPSGLKIEEFNGENVLMFRNVGMGWFGTTYKYSNFECTFDVPYILFNNILRENGTVRQPASTGFIFSYGDASDYYDSFGYDTAADAIIFENNEVRNFKDYSKRMVINNMDLYDRDNNIGYSVKIRVEDTQFTLQMKPLKASKWQDILSYKIGNETPMGYVHIWSASCANFAIDNFKIVNLDKDAKLVKADYKGSAIEGAEDWDYKPMEKVYLEVEDGEGSWSWPLTFAIAVALGVVIVVVSFVVTKSAKKPKKKLAKKEAEKDED